MFFAVGAVGGRIEKSLSAGRRRKKEDERKNHIPDRKAADVKPRVCAMNTEEAMLLLLLLVEAIFPSVLFYRRGRSSGRGE